jgi:serine/threonine protein kinase/alpha-tubulin suppressor-like RCC1 family protein
MAKSKGKCPGCDDVGPVGDACDGKACQKRGYHYIPNSLWKRAHDTQDGKPDPNIGKLIGDFLVVGLLGSGGFGKVYLALQAPLFRLKGALKLIEFPTENEEFAEALLEKFQGEAEALAELNHPNIVKLIKYGVHEGRPYLVMEFVDKGTTLRSEINVRAKREENFDHQELRHIFGQILNGLEAAHDKSIIHRDIKPENIMLQRVAGNPFHTKILDFGTAKIVERRDTTKWPLGSPSYMAPEQIGLSGLGTWTDLYALGVMAFELVTGRRPFPGETDKEIVSKKLDEEFDPFEQIAHLKLPSEFLLFLGKALAREPKHRFQDVPEFQQAMRVAFDSLAEFDGAVGPGGANLTFLLQSGDIVEFASDKQLASEPQDKPSKLPEVSSDKPKSAMGRVIAALAILAAAGGGLFYFGADFMPMTSNATPKAADATVGVPDGGSALVSADESDDDAGVEDIEETSDVPDGADVESDADDAEEDVEPSPFAALPAHGVVGLSTGKFHSCALRKDGRIHCWGANRDGELGTGDLRAVGDDETAESAVLLDFGDPVKDVIAAGDREASFTCVLTQPGDVRCWGANKHGQLGYGHTDSIGDEKPVGPQHPPPVQVGGEVKELAAGASKFASHVCAILADDSVKCWGSSKFGMLGYGHTNEIGDDEIPATVGPVQVGGTPMEISAGKYNTCVVLDDGKLRCWGWNSVGQLGLGNTEDLGDDEIPTSVDPIDVGGKVEQVSVGRRHVCALLDEGRVRCWGWNNKGQLGYGHTRNIGDDETPADAGDVELSAPAVAVAAGGLHSCALLVDGKVQCWGDNKFGQLGYGHERNVGDTNPPKSVGTVYLDQDVLAVSTGSYHTCVIVESGQLRCWGFNTDGQLGLGHTNNVGDDETPMSVTTFGFGE